MEAWAILGIEPTRDARAIRMAYVRRLRHAQPETDPEGFMALRAAYEAALATLEADAGPGPLASPFDDSAPGAPAFEGPEAAPNAPYPSDAIDLPIRLAARLIAEAPALEPAQALDRLHRAQGQLRVREDGAGLQHFEWVLGEMLSTAEPFPGEFAAIAWRHFRWEGRGHRFWLFVPELARRLRRRTLPWILRDDPAIDVPDFPGYTGDLQALRRPPDPDAGVLRESRERRLAVMAWLDRECPEYVTRFGDPRTAQAWRDLLPGRALTRGEWIAVIVAGNLLPVFGMRLLPHCTAADAESPIGLLACDVGVFAPFVRSQAAFLLQAGVGTLLAWMLARRIVRFHERRQRRRALAATPG